MLLNRRDFLIHSASTSAVLALGTGCAGWRPRTDWLANPFLQGNYAPVHEEFTADHMTVIGTLPPEMDGMYVRNGPNPQFPPIKNYHWFEGDGMLHGVRVQGVGQVIATATSAPRDGRRNRTPARPSIAASSTPRTCGGC